MKIFKIAGVTARLSDVDGSDRISITQTLKSTLNKAFLEAAATYLNAAKTYVYIGVARKNPDVEGFVTLVVEVEITPDFPKNYYPWLASLIQKILKSYGAVILDINQSHEVSSGLPMYSFLIKMNYLSIARFEEKNNVAYFFPDEEAFEYVELILGFNPSTTTPEHVMGMSQLTTSLREFKDDVDRHNMTIEEYLLSDYIMNTCSPSLQNAIKQYATNIAAYVEKLWSLVQANRGLDLPWVRVTRK